MFEILIYNLCLCIFRFKWTHLSERLAYEKAVHHQRLRTEISQAKREADFFKANVEKSKRYVVATAIDENISATHCSGH